jgi:membrane protein
MTTAEPGRRRPRAATRDTDASGRSRPDTGVGLLDRGLHALDRFQQRHRRLSFVMGVLKKFADDQAGHLSAVIAFYAFFSIFPLLLVFVTVLGIVLQGNTRAQDDIINSTLSQFPIIGDNLRHNVHSLPASGVALAIGLIGSLLAGLAITNATQAAFNRVWSVPYKRRADFIRVRLRGLGLLTILGLLFIVSTGIASFVTAQTQGTGTLIGGIAVALLVNLVLFFMTFRLLTEAPNRELLPGVVFGAIAWQVLQHVGAYYVDHVIRRSGETSGLFAIVLGLLTWLYLGAHVLLIAAEINVVRAGRLWPRSLFSSPLTRGDKRALTAYAETEERVHEEDVDVMFDDAPPSR